jgi:beta-phosphoglucomutase-like phosphatase (HAD superfamily)
LTFTLDIRSRLQDAAGYIFDMDGTMINSMPWHAKSWTVFAARHGIRMDLAEMMRRTTGRNGAECVRELFGREMDDDEAWSLIREKEVIYRDLFAPEFAEVNGFTAFAAEALAHGLKVGVGTAGDKHNIDFVLSRLKLPQAPGAVVGGDEGLPGKPEPAIFLEVARRLNVPPAACIVFEDAPFGIEAAHRAGMHAVAICTGHSTEELAGPHVLAAVPDFRALLNSNFLESLHVAIA